MGNNKYIQVSLLGFSQASREHGAVSRGRWSLSDARLGDLFHEVNPMREILKWIWVSNCCPGHDTFPTETYNNRRSKKARAKWKRKEHQLVRQLVKRSLRKEYSKLMSEDA